ncbi:MAG: Eco57I restriction-modification methylase domain-containing protein [Bergeyella sp.]
MNQLIQSFSIKALADFFKNAISAFKTETEDLDYIIEDKDFPNFSELTRIGNVEFKNSDELIVFSCKYNGQLSERSSKKKQFEIAKLVLKEDFKDGAIFVFYDDAGKFRFSFIRRNWEGKADKKYSSWKRFTYFVTPEDTNKTFRQRIGNCTFKDLDSIQEAFSVEKLTKEFYNDLFKWYQWTLTQEVGITFPNNTTTSDDDRVKLEEQMIRLITRLLFVWFIKQKNLVPDDLFKKDKLSEILKDFTSDSFSDGNYYNAILQNLFFATLNKAVTEREFAKLVDKRDIKTRYRYAEMFTMSEEEILDLFRPIPFLNGGLFECLDKEESTDGIKYHLDGFSRSDKKLNGNFKHRAFIPNVVFFGDDKNEGLIPLLERYNFTVEENVPNEVQVALDPELLGNVFENLLGAFNPETQESARKQSGSFYTPKEIVAYMVDESLIAYLNNALPDLDEEIVRQLFEQEDLPESLANDHDLCEKIATTLRAVKILDPACGSGAFPMGILNRMVEVLEKLDAQNKESHHDLKLHLIEECIYGVDIQTIAAQISKLRFFISLIVEQETMDLSKPEENYGVLTLPNLETKFVAANTLVGMKKKKEGDFVNSLFTDPRIDETKHQLMEVRKEHFYAKSAYKKKELRDKDAELRTLLSKLLQDNDEFAPEDAVQFSQWNPYDQNASSPFFEPEWMFGLSKENGGLNSADGGYFDIVIGNPPYIDSETMINTGQETLRLYLSKESQYCRGNWDIYIAFFEKGFNFINNIGVLTYITPDKWLSKPFGCELRKGLKDYIISVTESGRDVFETANVDSIITFFTKKKRENIIINKFENSKPSYFSTVNRAIMKEPYSLDWLFSPHIKLLNKIDSNMGNLSNYVTCENACATSDAYKIKPFISNNPYNQNRLKIINTGTIGKYCSKWGEREMTYLKDKYLTPTVNKNEFFKEFTNSYGKKSILPKLIIKGLTLLDACIDLEGIIIPGKSTLVITENKGNEENLYFPLALINSNISIFYIREKYRGASYNQGINFNPDMINNLPIPPMTESTKNKIIFLTQSILSSIGENKDISELQRELDLIFYKLYNLSDEEIAIIENT